MATASKTSLYIHIGTPKTGTSALQYFLYNHHARLKSHGILYPQKLIASPSDPKHQFFFNCVFSGNQQRLKDSIKRICSEMGDSVHTILLSAEGFYHHTYEFTGTSWSLIRNFAENYDVYSVVYLRPQADYAESMYRQYLKNPRGRISGYGSGMTIIEFLGIPRVKQNLDYYDSLTQWAAAVGEKKILVRRYSNEVVRDFLSLIKADWMTGGEPIKRNTSFTREMAEILRQANPYLDNDQRNSLIVLMEKNLEQSRSGRDMPFLSPSERRELMDNHKERNDMLAQKWLNEKELFLNYQLHDGDSWEPVGSDQKYLRLLVENILTNNDCPDNIRIF